MRLWKGLDAGGIPAGWVPTAGMLVDRSLVTELTIRFDAGGHAGRPLFGDGTDNPFRCWRACRRILPEAELANILHRETKNVALIATRFSVLHNYWHEHDNAA
jgi:hypothetical protein